MKGSPPEPGSCSPSGVAHECLDPGDPSPRRRMRCSDPLAPTHRPRMVPGGEHAAQCARQLAAETHSDGTLVRIELRLVPDQVPERSTRTDPGGEHPRDGPDHHGDRIGHHVDQRRIAAVRLARGDRDVLEEDADSGEQDHRCRQPVPDRDRDGVQTEVMTQLVREDPLQFGRGQLVDGERRDDHQMAPARERVQLIGRKDPYDIAVIGETVRADDLAPQRRDRGFLGLGRSSGAEDRCEDPHLEAADEQQRAGCGESDQRPGERHPGHHVQRQPDDEHGQQREGEHRNDRDERPQRRPLHPSSMSGRGQDGHHGQDRNPDGGMLRVLAADRDPRGRAQAGQSIRRYAGEAPSTSTVSGTVGAGILQR